MIGLLGRGSQAGKRVFWGGGSQKKSNFSLIQDPAYGTMSRFPDVEFVGKNNVGMIGVVYVFEESNLHLPHRGRPAGASCFLNIEAITVDSVFSGKNNFDYKLFDMFLFDWNMVKKYGGGFQWDYIVRYEVCYFLSKLPVFDGIWA